MTFKYFQEKVFKKFPTLQLKYFMTLVVVGGGGMCDLCEQSISNNPLRLGIVAL